MQRRGGAISYELAVLGISAVLGKAVARKLYLPYRERQLTHKAYLLRDDVEEQLVMSRIFAELKSRLGEANARSRTYRTASGV